jgi:hypothetical protein
LQFAPHLWRRGAMYYWRRRLPTALATCQKRPHVFVSLGMREPHIARALAVQLDAAFGAIVMTLDPTFLSKTQLNGMLRAVFAHHSEKLDRVAAAAKGFPAPNAFFNRSLKSWLPLIRTMKLAARRLGSIAA